MWLFKVYSLQNMITHFDVATKILMLLMPFLFAIIILI